MEACARFRNKRFVKTNLHVSPPDSFDVLDFDLLCFIGALVSEAWHQEVKKHEEKIENLIHSYKELVKEKCKVVQYVVFMVTYRLLVMNIIHSQ